MEKCENGWKSKLGIQIDEVGCGRWLFGLNIAYENFHHISYELYLNIYLGKYQISIGKMHKGM